MWYLQVALIAGLVVHYTVTTSAQVTPPMPPVPTTPKWQPPEHDWEFTVYHYPNSLTQPDRCNQTKASYLCDPKSLLNPEVQSEITERLNHGIGSKALGVAIVHKIKVLDALDLNPTMKAEATKILNNLVTANMSKEGSLLFVSDQDKQVVFTSFSKNPCADLQHSNITVLFEKGNLSLSEYVNSATKIYISSACDNTSPGSPGSTVGIVLAVIVSIVLIAAIVVVVCLVMKRQKKKSNSLREEHPLKEQPAA